MTTSELVDILDIERVDEDRYVGTNLPNTQGVIFGGQLLAQAIAAAAKSAPEIRVKSMHTVFARGGAPDQPVEIGVDRLHEGRTFGTVEVSIKQRERLCTRSLVLLDRRDPEVITHHADAPAVAPADDCAPRSGVRAGWEVRISDDVDIADPDAVGPAELLVWSRFDAVPADEWVSQALLAYASDAFLIGTAMRPHPGVGQALAHDSLATSVITQSLTFHDTFDAGDWLLLAHSSPYAGHGRSFGRADVFTADGRLVASYSQENMIRAFSSDRQPEPGERSKY